MFLAAWIVFVFGAGKHSPSGGSRVLPLIALGVVALYTVRFVAGLPTTLRPMLLRTAFSRATALGTVCELIAAACLAWAIIAPDAHVTATIMPLAVVATLVARFVLRAALRT